MASNVPDSYADDFLEQILAIPSYSAPMNDGSPADSVMPETSSSSVVQLDHHEDGSGRGSGRGGSGFEGSMFTSGLSMDNGGFQSAEAPPERESLPFSSFGHVQQPPYSIPVQPNIPHVQQQAFHGQPVPAMVVSAPQPPVVRPRVRARRGQATDPHSIAERIRRERIAEKVRALQELVPSCNKTDRAAMLDGILEYVKFLRLQVKVLSMSRLGGAGAVAQLVTEIPPSSVEGEANEDESNQQPWDKWSNDSTEQEVLKLMEEDVGAAMQFLQSKALCIMPTSLAALIYSTQQPETTKLVKAELNGSS